ncbi:MAG TPA: hypothetical protein VMJ93_15785 [Verrucomicrobiae bacterium]|nr:hypothetical protein [Verrucomicrobiae bacterium]
MKICSFRTIELVFTLLLAAALATPQDVFAQNHVVSPTQLQKDVAAASSVRQKNLDQLESFLESPEAVRAMKSAHLDYREVQKAVPQLSDQDLAMLSARSVKAQKDFAAGDITDRDLLIILVAVAALILIIVAVR